jgi:tRNA(Ile)-lysidine synthase
MNIIYVVNRNILRPLLGTTKKQILEYANYHNLTYLTDPTNDDPDYCLRNKVNRLVMGGIKTCFPGVEKTVKRLIQEKESRLKEEI